MFEVGQRTIIVRIINAVIAEGTGVPLVGKERHKLAGPVISGGHLLYLGPLLAGLGESSHPFFVSIAGHDRHVVPLRVRREGEEIETLCRDVVGPLHRALAVTDSIVVVQVAPKKLEFSRGWLR